MREEGERNLAKAVNERLEKKTLLLNPEKLQKACRALNARSESEAVRRLIDECIAYENALAAARRIQKRGTFGREGSKSKGRQA